jgi:hypothetical protein
VAQGPILIFDKSSLKSLNLGQAVLLDSIWALRVVAAD